MRSRLSLADERSRDPDDAGAPLAPGRQRQIFDLVREEGTVRVRALALGLQVSDMTIRRDIDALAGQGLVEKIHGGAKLPEHLSKDEPRFDTKRLRQGNEKLAIARSAMDLVMPGMVIGVSAGSTTYALAEMLGTVEGLTIVTNSIPVADRLAQGKESVAGTVLLTGGERTPSDALVGPLAVSALRQLHVDLLFLGVHGAHEKAGITSPNLLESELDQFFMAAASSVVVLADHTKWGTIGMSKISPLTSINTFITDAGIGASARDALQNAVGDLVVAP